MEIRQQILVIASKLSGWCYCHCKPENTLEQMNLVSEKLITFVNLLKDVLKIETPEEVYNEWITLNDIIIYVSNNQ